MKTGLRSAAFFAIFLTAATGAAHAHTGVSDTHGFMSGFAHPVGGLDHILAMVMVGLFAAQLGRRAVWLVPMSFVTLMALGGVLGLAGVTVPFFELGIGLSVVVLGAVVAIRMRAAVPVAMALVGFFAVFHGYAHGSEMPENAAGFAYGVGFLTATALLHAVGIGLGSAIGAGSGRRAQLLIRSVGASVAVIGLSLVSGVL